MIVDDRRVLIGSANINDRSLLGDRDSELAIHVEDQDLRPTSYSYSVSKDIQRLRIDLYIEHFGLTYAEAENFLDEDTWQLIKNRAKNNTKVYREVFGCYPDDTMTQYSEIEEVRKRSRPEKYSELKEEIVGHAVEVPLKFLENEDLNLSAKEKEFFLPNIFFT
jgi:phospholipase D1/2